VFGSTFSTDHAVSHKYLHGLCRKWSKTAIFLVIFDSIGLPTTAFDKIPKDWFLLMNGECCAVFTLVIADNKFISFCNYSVLPSLYYCCCCCFLQFSGTHCTKFFVIVALLLLWLWRTAQWNTFRCLAKSVTFFKPCGAVILTFHICKTVPGFWKNH